MDRLITIFTTILVLLFVGCGESDGRLFDDNTTTTTSICEGNVSVRKTVDLLKEYNLTYKDEVFYFSFDGVDDYDINPTVKDSGTYDSNINSTEDDNIKNFSITLKDSGDITLYGEMNGSIDFYCVDLDGDGNKETTRIRYYHNYINKLLVAKRNQ